MSRETLIRSVTLLFLLYGDAAFATPLDKVQFIKISPGGEKAVIKTADGAEQKGTGYFYEV